MHIKSQYTQKSLKEAYQIVTQDLFQRLVKAKPDQLSKQRLIICQL